MALNFLEQHEDPHGEIDGDCKNPWRWNWLLEKVLVYAFLLKQNSCSDLMYLLFPKSQPRILLFSSCFSFLNFGIFTKYETHKLRNHKKLLNFVKKRVRNYKH